jgi:copper resistance protein C
MRRFIFVIAAMALLLLGAAPAFAHAHLERATPAVGSTVAAAPKEVVLWFSQKLEPAFSTIEVRDAKGGAVQSGKATVGSDRTQLRVPLKTLGPGTYKVIWHVLSVDTHRTQGDFGFTVGK